MISLTKIIDYFIDTYMIQTSIGKYLYVYVYDVYKVVRFTYNYRIYSVSCWQNLNYVPQPPVRKLLR